MAGSQLDTSALYGLPLAEFTKARNELAKQVRAQGDREQAERIGRLEKPSLVAWALNMLPRLRADELGELLRAGEEAESAQAVALGGGGDPARLQETTTELRRSARSVAEETGEILVKDGHAAREETLLRIARALETSAVTAAGRQALLRGTFTEEPEAAGFELFAQLSASPAEKPTRRAGGKALREPPERVRHREQAEARQQARRAVEEARTDLRERRRERAEAEAATRDAERAAQARQREAEKAWQLVEQSRELAARAREAEVKAEQSLAQARTRTDRG